MITIVLGFGLVIGGLEFTAVHLNIRQLNLRPIFVLDLSGRVVSMPIMIVWALALAKCLGTRRRRSRRQPSSAGLLAQSIPGPAMSLQWDQEHVREIVRFGKWINVSSAATFIAGQSDRIVMGLLFPASVFGQYAIARLLIDTSQGLFERVNSTLGLPVLSEISRRGRHEIKEKYYRYRLAFDASAPLLGGMLFSLDQSLSAPLRRAV